MCDSAINLVKLQTEKPIQQNHRLLAEVHDVHRKIHFLLYWSHVKMRSQKDAQYIAQAETY